MGIRTTPKAPAALHPDSHQKLQQEEHHARGVRGGEPGRDILQGHVAGNVRFNASAGINGIPCILGARDPSDNTGPKGGPPNVTGRQGEKGAGN